jgi:hypothetical protein
MKTPLLYKVYRALRKGWKGMTPEAQQAVKSFVASQKTAHGYMNAGGHEDAYYKQFGEVLEAVFAPIKLFHTKINLTVQESRHQDTVYGRFFDFIESEVRSKGQGAWSKGQGAWSKGQEVRTTNAVCCVLAMQHQMGQKHDAACVDWLQQRQDETGGFYASEQAPIPDLLSTAVGLFTLRLIGKEVKDATPFIEAHWLDNGGFAPTIYDEYSDVEYVFYGLLALGSK